MNEAIKIKTRNTSNKMLNNFKKITRNVCQKVFFFSFTKMKKKTHKTFKKYP